MGAGNFKKDKGNRNNGYGRGFSDNRQSSGSGYTGAPYNFVPFPKQVYEYPEGKQTTHDQMSKELFTGEIVYEITAQTPVIVENGRKEFAKDALGRYAIPGSTMRGLIRNNVQVLGLAGYDDDIDDYALMYRNVANGAEQERYTDILGAKPLKINDGSKQYCMNVLRNVRAGYVKNEGGTYTICQTCVDGIRSEFQKMNYYALSERKIINDYLRHPDHFSYPVFRPDGKSILQHEFSEFKRTEIKGRVHYKGEKNNNYQPYQIPVSYQVANLKDIIAVGKPGQYEHQGYAVSTGKMNEKKVVYIIPQADRTKQTITIPPEDVRAFKIDMKKKENTLKQFGGRAYFDLPQDGKEKAVFYIQLGDRLYFGFTPRLRLFYDHTVKEGLRQKCKKDRIDYNRSLFGYARADQSYRSKVSFSDAVVTGKARTASSQRLILAEPKPASCPDYLKPQTSRMGQAESVTYNADQFELRGAKQYWLHKQAPVNTAGMNPRNEKVASVIHPLETGTKFQGRIRFQNLLQDELGLLLWAVRLEDNCWMNVGKAKAYGYGAISVSILEAKVLDLEKAYEQTQTLDFQPFCSISVDEMIEAYQTQISRFLGGRKPQTLPHIKDFFRMKDAGHIPPDEKTRYMSIEKKEYQNRNKNRNGVLPSVEEVVKQR